MPSTAQGTSRTPHLLALMNAARATGTFTGEMTRPDGTVIPPTGKAFDLEFGQTSRWDGDRLIVISAFWDSALQARQLGLA